MPLPRPSATVAMTCRLRTGQTQRECRWRLAERQRRRRTPRAIVAAMCLGSGPTDVASMRSRIGRWPPRRAALRRSTCHNYAVAPSSPAAASRQAGHPQNPARKPAPASREHVLVVDAEVGGTPLPPSMRLDTAGTARPLDHRASASNAAATMGLRTCAEPESPAGVSTRRTDFHPSDMLRLRPSNEPL